MLAYEIGLVLVGECLSAVLCIGTTLPIFQSVGSTLNSSEYPKILDMIIEEYIWVFFCFVF